ncbi:hypothetical protein ACFQ22_08545, partial [Lentilactobacillus raoultii]
ILLDADTAHQPLYSRQAIADRSRTNQTTVIKTLKQFLDEGLDSVLQIKRNRNSDYARQKVDAADETKLIQLAYGPAPKGHARWSLRLLEKAAEVELAHPIKKDAIGRLFKKTASTSQKTLLGNPNRPRCQLCCGHGRCLRRLCSAL